MPFESAYSQTALGKELEDFKNQINQIEQYPFTLAWFSEFVDRQAKVTYFCFLILLHSRKIPLSPFQESHKKIKPPILIDPETNCQPPNQSPLKF